MAIFNKSDISDHISTDTNTTIITAGAKIRGELDLTCSLYIDGILEGNINSTKDVNVGKNGHVKGVILTDRLVVQGFVEGSIDAARVDIKAAGHVMGEIKSSELVIEAKGIFEGTSVIKNDATI
ncbi:MAG: polymer-forming cytoskeletal protein [Campylobacterales bacterium]|nr:polymer-forming cytoskeletal protein [Campylobacterales bacterium]